MRRNSYFSTIYQIVSLVKKSKSKGLTGEESAILKEWLDSDPKNIALYNKLLADIDQQKLENMLSKDAEDRYSQLIIASDRRSASRIFRFSRWVAAAVAVFLLFSPQYVDDTRNYVVKKLRHDLPKANYIPDEISIQSNSGFKDLIVNEDSVYAVASLFGTAPVEGRADHEEDQLVTISTPLGKTISFKLQDGSTVYLNSKSQITFKNSSRFKSARHVKLVGEAFFEVAEDKDSPFIIENNGREIKVLGTSFNVKGYDGQSKFKLALATGKVELKIEDQGYSGVLTPGNEVTYDASNDRITKVIKDVSHMGAWRDGIYMFENASIQELTNDLQQMYPITFRYEGDLPQYRFSGEVVREEDWRKVLGKLEMTNRVQFAIEENLVTVQEAPRKYIIE